MTSLIISAIVICLFAIWVDDQNINLYRYPKIFAKCIPFIKVKFSTWNKTFIIAMSYVKPAKKLTDAMLEIPYFYAINSFRKSYKVKVREHVLNDARDTFRKFIEASKVPTSWWNIYSPGMEVTIKNENLHEVRKVIREFLGEWSDKIESTRVSYNNENLEVTYLGKQKFRGFSVSIKTEYPLNDLPKGLLKEGCKVIEETETTTTKSVICELGSNSDDMPFYPK